jgi:hypothetical protein
METQCMTRSQENNGNPVHDKESRKNGNPEHDKEPRK